MGGFNEFQVFDIRRPGKPARIGKYPLGEQGVGQIHAENGRLWIATYTGGLYLYEYCQAGNLDYVGTVMKGSNIRFLVSDPKDIKIGSHTGYRTGTGFDKDFCMTDTHLFGVGYNGFAEVYELPGFLRQ